MSECIKFYTTQVFSELLIATIAKNHTWYRMGHIVIFNNLAGNSNVALLVVPMVHEIIQYR